MSTRTPRRTRSTGSACGCPATSFKGDVNYRTLQKLLTRVDQRGFERCVHANNASTNPTQCCTNYALALPQPRSAQQLEFHVAFMKAAARVIYRGSWETERPAIMKRYGWETSNSEVLIRHTRAHKLGAVYTVRLTRARCCVRSTPRRFGKTFSCAQRATTQAPSAPNAPPARADRARVLGSIAIFCACLALAFGLEIGAPWPHPRWRSCCVY